MDIDHRVQFSVGSITLLPEELTAAIGLEPDRVTRRGSRDPARPLPPENAWTVQSRRGGASLEDQVREVLDRIRPAAARIGDLVRSGTADCALVVVRYLNLDDDAPVPSPVEGLTLLQGQDPRLGWTLAADDVALLATAGAGVVVDEYP